jgi:hypothetical protein
MPDALQKLTPKPEYDAGHVPMGEEMDSARWTLPPIVPVAIAAAVLGILLASYLLASKKAPTSSGAITRFQAIPIHTESKGSIGTGLEGMVTNNVEKYDQMVIAVQLNIHNATPKPMYVKGLEANLTTDTGEEKTDLAAPAADYDVLFQAYPQLKQDAIAPLKAESTIAAGATQEGMAIFSFPVTKDVWDKRKSLKIAVNLYDHAPLVLDTAQVAANKSQ